MDFSVREKQILDAMILGLSDQDISDKFGIATSTVRTYIHRIFIKLGVRTRLSAAVLYYQNYLNTFDEI